MLIFCLSIILNLYFECESQEQPWNIDRQLAGHPNSKGPPKIFEQLTFFHEPNRVGYSGQTIKLPCVGASIDNSGTGGGIYNSLDTYSPPHIIYQWTKDDEEINNLAWTGFEVKTQRVTYDSQTHLIEVKRLQDLRDAPADGTSTIHEDPISTFSSILELYGASNILKQHDIKPSPPVSLAVRGEGFTDSQFGDYARTNSYSKNKNHIDLNTLTIDQAFPVDSGIYRCKILNGFGHVELTYKLIILDLKPVKVLNQSETNYVSLQKFSNTLPGSGPKLNIPSDRNLINPKREEVSKPFDILLTKHVGNSASLKCPLDPSQVGFPSPRITWYKNNKPVWTNDNHLNSNVIPSIQNTDRMIRTSPEKSGSVAISFPNLRVDDEGFYTCKAYNEFGAVNYTTFVEIIEQIKGPKLVGEHPIDITVPPGQEATLQCDVISELKPKIQWLRRIENMAIFGTQIDDSTNHKAHRDQFKVDENLAPTANLIFKLGSYQYHLINSYEDNPTIETFWNGPNGKWFSQLSYWNASKEVAGYYVCMATNAIGFDYRGSWIKIQTTAGHNYVDSHSTSSKPVISVTKDNRLGEIAIADTRLPSLKNVAHTLSTSALIAVPILSVALILLAIFTVKMFMSPTRSALGGKQRKKNHSPPQSYYIPSSNKPITTIPQVTHMTSEQWLDNTNWNYGRERGDGICHGQVNHSSNTSSNNDIITTVSTTLPLLPQSSNKDSHHNNSDISTKYEIIYDEPMTASSSSTAHLAKFVKYLFECTFFGMDKRNKIRLNQTKPINEKSILRSPVNGQNLLNGEMRSTLKRLYVPPLPQNNNFDVHLPGDNNLPYRLRDDKNEANLNVQVKGNAIGQMVSEPINCHHMTSRANLNTTLRGGGEYVPHVPFHSTLNAMNRNCHPTNSNSVRSTRNDRVIIVAAAVMGRQQREPYPNELNLSPNVTLSVNCGNTTCHNNTPESSSHFSSSFHEPGIPDRFISSLKDKNICLVPSSNELPSSAARENPEWDPEIRNLRMNVDVVNVSRYPMSAIASRRLNHIHPNNYTTSSATDSHLNFHTNPLFIGGNDQINLFRREPPDHGVTINNHLRLPTPPPLLSSCSGDSGETKNENHFTGSQPYDPKQGSPYVPGSDNSAGMSSTSITERHCGPGDNTEGESSTFLSSDATSTDIHGNLVLETCKALRRGVPYSNNRDLNTTVNADLRKDNGKKLNNTISGGEVQGGNSRFTQYPQPNHFQNISHNRDSRLNYPPSHFVSQTTNHQNYQFKNAEPHETYNGINKIGTTQVQISNCVSHPPKYHNHEEPYIKNILTKQVTIEGKKFLKPPNALDDTYLVYSL